MAASGDRLDLVILGVTGFTGQNCIPYVHKFVKESGKSLSWGVAGRSEEKMRDVLNRMGAKIGADLSQQQIIVTDIKSDKSVLQMAEKTKILINCAGPFRNLGEPVITACIETGTHYVDVTAEPNVIRSIFLKYNEAAQHKGVYLINACGVDVIPNDLGVLFTKDQFDGTLNSAVTHLEVWEEEGEKIPGPALSCGSWNSLIYCIKDGLRLSETKEWLFPERIPFKPTLKIRYLPYRPRVVEGWALPFLAADRWMLNRTQKYFYENDNKRPVQVDTKIMLKGFPSLVGWLFSAFVWLVFGVFECGRKLLLNYPHIFTRGYFRKDQEPTEERIERTVFQITIYGEGWKEKMSNPNDKYPYPPNRSIVTRVRTKNPGYAGTCACVVGAAFMIATEKNKLPVNGGVYTPGIAFGKTSLIELLNKNGVTFEVISQKDI